MTAPQDTAFTERLSELRHEVRTPIGHIMGYAELIAEDLDEAGRQAYGHDLASIIHAGQKMLALLDQHLGPTRKSPDEIDFGSAQFALRLNLNHVAGYAEILREEAVERDEPDIARDLDRITAAERRIVALIEDMAGRLIDKAPAEKSARDTGEPVPATIAGIGGEILVVDDDPANRELLTRRLARGGYTSRTVGSGEEALALLQEQSFDLVLLDQMMPGLSGLETLRVMKDTPRLRATPVLMLSAADDADVMVRCILAGAEDYVAKPFNPVLLTARINAVLEKIRLRQNAARQIKVFISSPGDVIPERQIAKSVLGRLNAEFSGRAFMAPVMWEEEPLLATQTFQAQIHPPSQAEIYLGIVWSRIGSPLPDTIRRPDGTAYELGSVYEFEDARTGYETTGKPEMLLYVKQGAPAIPIADRAVVLDRLEQYDLLRAYLAKNLMGEDGTYSAAFHTFDSSDAFETLVETHLRKLVEKDSDRRLMTRSDRLPADPPHSRRAPQRE